MFGVCDDDVKQDNQCIHYFWPTTNYPKHNKKVKT